MIFKGAILFVAVLSSILVRKIEKLEKGRDWVIFDFFFPYSLVQEHGLHGLVTEKRKK